MKKTTGIICGLLALSLTGGALFGQTNGLEMPMLAQHLPISGFEVVNRIPSSRMAGLPAVLPVYKYSAKPREFSAAALQTLLDQSAFAGTNAAELHKSHFGTAQPDETVRLATGRNMDYFIITPATGLVAMQNQSRGTNAAQPPADAMPSFDVIRERLFRHAEAFGISTNDMERAPDGAVHTPRTEDRITRMGGAVKFIGRRSMKFSRSIGSYALLANDDKIELVLGGNGRIQKFELKWPVIEPVRTNRVFTTERLVAEIKRGNMLADIGNEYPSDGIAKIVLKDIRICYYAFSPRGFGYVPPGTEIFPVASLHVAFTSKLGKTQDGALFAPILETR